MKYRILLAVLVVSILALVGCRTGEYKGLDLEIYEKMPGLLEAEPKLAENLLHDENGNLVVEFEKGTMFLHVALGLDEGTRRETVSKAIVIFHAQYVDNPANQKKNETLKREFITIKSYVEETELYVHEWNLNEEQADVKSDRFGNFM